MAKLLPVDPKRRNQRKAIVLRPIHPNAGIETEYRKRLQRLIDDMHRSTLYWLKATYRANPPKLAQDETAAATLRRAIRALTARWLDRFETASHDLAEYFATAVADRSDAVLKKILKDGGFSVEWKMTAAQRDVMRATVEQSVGLIKSVPQQYLGRVEQLVMQSVQTGRDLGSLTTALQEQFGVTRRRAEFIAHSQNNMATAAFTKARQQEIGIDEAVWVHSGGGRHPRPTHKKAGADRERYKVSEGWADPALGGKRIWPGTEPNCRCVSRPVIKGFN